MAETESAPQRVKTNTQLANEIGEALARGEMTQEEAQAQLARINRERGPAGRTNARRDAYLMREIPAEDIPAEDKRLRSEPIEDEVRREFDVPENATALYPKEVIQVLGKVPSGWPDVVNLQGYDIVMFGQRVFCRSRRRAATAIPMFRYHESQVLLRF